jgi:RNA polymerase sigma-70 factor (sigma-E family)
VSSVSGTACAPARSPAIADSGERSDELGFDAFARYHLPKLGRLGYTLTGDHATADDLAAETLIAAWNQWGRVLTVDRPTAYVRRIMINIALSRVRASAREQRRMRLFCADRQDVHVDPDGAAAVAVREALRELPVRRRTCVVLRHAFDLSEGDVAHMLGVSVGTVKSQTSRGMAQLQRLLAERGDEGEGAVDDRTSTKNITATRTIR